MGANPSRVYEKCRLWQFPKFFRAAVFLVKDLRLGPGEALVINVFFGAAPLPCQSASVGDVNTQSDVLQVTDLML